MPFRRSTVRLAALLAVSLLAACGSKSYCLREQKYDHVASIPPVAGGDGLAIPSSPTALRVPPQPADVPDVPFGYKVTDAKGRTQNACLDEPPPLPANADASATSAQ
jgi:hypothetical protein